LKIAPPSERRKACAGEYSFSASARPDEQAHATYQQSLKEELPAVGRI